MDVYLAYLRKSRKDAELEAQGAGETLARHRKILQDLAERGGYNVVKTFEEVVSGDSISDRPEMQKLLKEVETGLYAGVLVVEVERLSRGDGIDQAIVSKTFQYTNTKIITPVKVYDPANEMDNEYFEFGLFMSRREYNTIKRRLKRGKEAAAREGKWSNGFAPYGYKTVKIPGQKGCTLEPTDKAAIIKAIFEQYLRGDSLQTIADTLNTAGIPTPTQRNGWRQENIGVIIRNPVYAGYIRYNNWKTERRIVDGEIVGKRARSAEDEIIIVKGLHPAIISEGDFQKAQQIMDAKRVRTAKKLPLKNPFSSILRCSACGYAMTGKRYDDGSGGFLYCPMCSAHVGAKIEEVDAAVTQALKEWLAELPAEAETVGQEENAGEKSQYEIIAEQKQAEIDQLDAQLKRAYELVEQNVYTIDLFRERAADIKAKRAAAEKALKTAKKEAADYAAALKSKKDVLPIARTVVAAYENAETPEEKNKLLRTILARIDYKKTRRANSPEGSDLTLVLYPLFSV